MNRLFFPTRKLAISFCVFGMFVSGAFTHAQDADVEAPDLAQIQTTIVQQQADAFVSAGKYQEAYYYIQELIQRFKDSKSEEILAQLEKLYFFLGIAAMSTDRPSEAVEAFKTYLQKFPQGNKARQVMELMGDAYSSMDAYDDAAKSWQKLRSTFKLTPKEDAPIAAKIAEA